MNRRGFLRVLGFGAAAAVAVPKIVTESLKPTKRGWFCTNPSVKIIKERASNIQSISIISAGSGYSCTPVITVHRRGDAV